MKNRTLLAHDHSELDGLLHAACSALAAGTVERSFETVDAFWARLAMHIRAGASPLVSGGASGN
jgi:hypothetical protein